ncbi:hypothetical protein PAXRUDRAFT_28810 [Paxillus rubicundulus Ve08.2h10]|uniref:Uncharacterized protein n=1 Tax=Paxillus rubicundulus Ve08.2h10 TaxID=930991 RepID=A0A0D0CPZ6_9AGAM|nr:hypothetical protein PAXRUDRAFT_28810 [Paxillus rubicundulus Ve08.2h10]
MQQETPTSAASERSGSVVTPRTSPTLEESVLMDPDTASSVVDTNKGLPRCTPTGSDGNAMAGVESKHNVASPFLDMMGDDSDSENLVPVIDTVKQLIKDVKKDKSFTLLLHLNALKQFIKLWEEYKKIPQICVLKMKASHTVATSIGKGPYMACKICTLYKYVKRFQTLPPAICCYLTVLADGEEAKKGIYVDGHERKDVVAYWKEFLQNFAANERMPLRKKGQGRAIHISGFIVEQSGWLALSENEQLENEALPADQRLGVKKTILLFEHKFPNTVAEFVFDQSSAHGAFTKDALNAKEMNIRPGGKQRIMHDTYILMDNPNPELCGKLQAMVFHKDLSPEDPNFEF